MDQSPAGRGAAECDGGGRRVVVATGGGVKNVATIARGTPSVGYEEGRLFQDCTSDVRVRNPLKN